MSFLEKVYNQSPIFFQNVMVTLAGHQKNRQRYGKIYREHRLFLADFDTWSYEKQKDYQNKELVKFIGYAVKYSPFYQRLYENVDLSTIQGVQDLKKLPVVNKEMLRKEMQQVVTIPQKGAIQEKTGGTTGKSLVIFRTVEDSMKRMAMLDHFKSRLGFENRKMKRATFNGKPIVPPNQKKKVFWRYNATMKQMIYTPFHMTEKTMKYYVASLNKYQPLAIDGYFTAMYDLAQYIERHNLKLTFSPVAIFPTSETLTLQGRELLERVFGCKVYDQYASGEGAPFVTECRCRRLHMELASGVFEHFEAGSDEILVTSFTTHGTPLIRYQIGDAMSFSDQGPSTCCCKLQGPIVKEIRGRKNDFLYTSQGAKVYAINVGGLIRDLGNAVIRIQVIQDQLDEVIILLEIDKALYEPKHDEMLKAEFQRRFGADTRLIIKHVDAIPREASGKFRMIKNNVNTK